MNNDNAESVAQVADSLDTLLTVMRLPPEFAIREMRHTLEHCRDVLRRIYVEESGSNPWK